MNSDLPWERRPWARAGQRVRFSGEGSPPGLEVWPLPRGGGRTLLSPKCHLAPCSRRPGLAGQPDSDLLDSSPPTEAQAGVDSGGPGGRIQLSRKPPALRPPVGFPSPEWRRLASSVSTPPAKADAPTCPNFPDALEGFCPSHFSSEGPGGPPDSPALQPPARTSTVCRPHLRLLLRPWSNPSPRLDNVCLHSDPTPPLIEALEQPP